MDRRRHQRFEIVGSVLGSIEIRRWLEVRNLGRGGALVEAPESREVGDRLRGFLSVGGQRWDMPVRVRHVSELPSSRGGYAVRLEFLEDASGMSDAALVDEQASPSSETAVPHERRRHHRVVNPVGVEFEAIERLTIQVRDIAMGGVLFTSKVPLANGHRARLHTWLGENRFEAQIEVRRVFAQGPAPEHQIGAAFVPIDEENRRALGSFLVTSTTERE
jgi:hypothetical protein